MRNTQLTTNISRATLEVLQACEALEAFTQEAHENIERGLLAATDEQQRVLFMQALELMNKHLMEACGVMLEPHYSTPIEPKKPA